MLKLGLTYRKITPARRIVNYLWVNWFLIELLSDSSYTWFKNSLIADKIFQEAYWHLKLLSYFYVFWNNLVFFSSKCYWLVHLAQFWYYPDWFPWCLLGWKHHVKSVKIRSFFWSVFSRIQSKYEKIRTRKNLVFGHFLHSENYY